MTAPHPAVTNSRARPRALGASWGETWPGSSQLFLLSTDGSGVGPTGAEDRLLHLQVLVFSLRQGASFNVMLSPPMCCRPARAPGPGGDTPPGHREVPGLRSQGRKPVAGPGRPGLLQHRRGRRGGGALLSDKAIWAPGPDTPASAGAAAALSRLVCPPLPAPFPQSSHPHGPWPVGCPPTPSKVTSAHSSEQTHCQGLTGGWGGSVLHPSPRLDASQLRASGGRPGPGAHEAPT